MGLGQEKWGMGVDKKERQRKWTKERAREGAVYYKHLRAKETLMNLVIRLLL